MPQGPFATAPFPAPSSFQNYAANNAGSQIKTGAGVLTGLSVNTVGTTSTVTLYDGTSTAGALIGEWATTTAGMIAVPTPVQFETGLFAVLAGGAAANVTVLYR